VVLTGQSPFGEMLAAPSAIEIDGIAGCLIDCNDSVRIHRLRQRGVGLATQAQLNWAAWHRAHSLDPQWDRTPLAMNDAMGYQWQRWGQWTAGDTRWQFETVDSSSKTPEEVCAWLVEWADRQLQMNSARTLPLSGHWWD
jgi:hypothetical protein